MVTVPALVAIPKRPSLLVRADRVPTVTVAPESGWLVPPSRTRPCTEVPLVTMTELLLLPPPQPAQMRATPQSASQDTPVSLERVSPESCIFKLPLETGSLAHGTRGRQAGARAG